MRIFNGKSGVMFTMIAILVTAILFVSFAPKSNVTLKDSLPAIETRITTADELLKTVKSTYVPVALRMSSYNALNALSIYVRLTGVPFANLDELETNFEEVMLNGSIDCDGAGHKSIEQCVCVDLGLGCDPENYILMKERNFTKRLQDIERAAASDLLFPLRFLGTYGDFDVKLLQDNRTGAFQVGVNITVNISLNVGYASWKDAQAVEVFFSFDGIEDPLYSVGSGAVNYFNSSNVSNWNLTNIYKEIDSRKYHFNANGSSFLTRYTGLDQRSDCCGIESFINPSAMPGFIDIERPYVDWCYFGTRCPLDQAGALWNITCISNQVGSNFEGFSLDTLHLGVLNLTGADEEGRQKFYGNTYANDPNTAECPNMMQDICSLPGSPFACS